ncbi:MAG: EamA family transporter [Alphaproteobacteria bacterium]|nr:EamA family transporter [Alphaproteobacteria bacterium]
MKPFDIVLGVIVAVTWGLGLTLAKAALGEFPPILLTAFRFSVTALALVWFVKPPLGQMRRILVISFVISTVQYSLTFTGLAGVDASTAAIVIQLEVPFAALLAAVFLGDRIGLWRIGGMLLAFAGVALIAGQPQMQDELLPLLLVLAGAFVWAVGNILVKTLDGAVDGFRLIAWLAVFSAPQLFIASFLLEDGQAAAIAGAGWLTWGVILYLGLVMTAFGYGLWFHLLNRHPVSHVMPFLLLLPVTAMISAVLLLDEIVTLVTVAGAALVLTGVGTIMYRQARRAGVPAPAAPEGVPPD